MGLRLEGFGGRRGRRACDRNANGAKWAPGGAMRLSWNEIRARAAAFARELCHSPVTTQLNADLANKADT